MDVAAPTLDPGRFREPVTGEPLEARWLGRIAYRDAWALQHELVERRIAGRIPDQLLLLEHPAVLTLGRHAEDGHVRASAGELAARGIELIHVERGGEVTYHGPGQLVAYPILALSRRGLLLRPLVRALEAAMAETCGAFGVAAGRRDGHPGCWCDVDAAAPRKIGALGMRVERGVSYHGIALNVDPDLADFDLIDPCGMPGVVSTSIAREFGGGGGGLDRADLDFLSTPRAEGRRGDARQGIDPEIRDLTLEADLDPGRSDAPRGITGDSWTAGATRPANVREIDSPSGPARDPDSTHDTIDAPMGINPGGLGGRSEHGSAPARRDALTGIAGGRSSPEPSVKWAARIFARAFAERLGAELRGFAAEMGDDADTNDADAHDPADGALAPHTHDRRGA